MEKSDFKIIKLFDVEMYIMNEVRTVPEVNLKVYGDGTATLEIDEYNRILNNLHREWMRKRNLDQ